MKHEISIAFVNERFNDKDEVVAAMAFKKLLQKFATAKGCQSTTGKAMIYELFKDESPRLQDDAWYYVDKLNKFIVGNPMASDADVTNCVKFFTDNIAELSEVSYESE